jgi:hypothetical protein
LVGILSSFTGKGSVLSVAPASSVAPIRSIDGGRLLATRPSPRYIRHVTDTNRHQSREAVLCEQPGLVGQTWASDWIRNMQNEGRRVCGGWPGTLPEARVRAQERLDRELRARGMSQLSQDELNQVTPLVYEHAKNEWLRVVKEVRTPASSHKARMA